MARPFAQQASQSLYQRTVGRLVQSGRRRCSSHLPGALNKRPLARRIAELLAPTGRGSQTCSKLVFEPLEPRLLLSADPLTYAAGAADQQDLTLRITEDSTGEAIVQLIDHNDSDAVLIEKDLDQTSSVTITGSDLDDKLTLDFDPEHDLSSLTITFDGGAADATGDGDTLVGPEQANEWSLTGTDTGTVNDHVTFTNVENVTGGGASDTFSLGPTGIVSGTIAGGDGDDELEGSDLAATWSISGDNAGSVVRDSDSVALATFTGIEILNGDDARDTLDYTSYSEGVTLDLDFGTAAGELTVIGFDRVLGTASGDTLTGGELDETFEAGTGDDTLAGGVGDDTYVFADDWGTDTVTESTEDSSIDGLDTLDFSAVTADLIFTVTADEILTVSDETNSLTASGSKI